MKRLFAAIITLTLAKSSSAQFEASKQVFNSPVLKTEIQKHKVVAILPFNATVSYKRLPKNFDAAANKTEEQSMSVNMQSGMYTYLLRKAKDFTVTFQDVERTNALLKQKGIYDKFNELTQDSVCKVLGVDAVIKSSYAYAKTGSEGGAIAKTILLGAGTGKVGSGALTMQINNGKDGEMLWRFYKEMDEDVTSSANAVMERMMRKVARNFPYEK
ncbi:hypothetical protein EXU57_18260 [Segetibacter sp. 3557_3]|uniref:hypothetical protein n=1 Tax=Segetibacter sp. 3557_3 TaxID=2547429 RepID=UPI001058CFE9|nr:hypothetical protein [Segetibacter sp. 3557_3]TDH23006.1 hypothetical protein EXU57_18260 [Segetibacter sp. 3557_3]